MAASVGQWGRWFAWRPVKIDGRHYWLRPVERRHVSVTHYAVLGAPNTSHFLQYRLVYEPTDFAKQLDAWKREFKDRIASFSTPLPKLADAKDIQEVMFTTNRLVLDIEDFCEQAITEQRAPNQTYGCAWVSIPGRHKIGNVERPKFDWLKLSVEEESADQHFLLLNLSRMTDNAFFGEIGSSSHDSVLLFVHGYNTSFKESVFKTAQIAFDANFAGKVIAYSWPSKASVTGYDYDRESALMSAASLLMLLRQISVSAKNLFLVAHSVSIR